MKTVLVPFLQEELKEGNGWGAACEQVLEMVEQALTKDTTAID